MTLCYSSNKPRGKWGKSGPREVDFPRIFLRSPLPVKIEAHLRRTGRLVQCPFYAAGLHVLGGLNPVGHLTQEAKLRLGEMGGKHPQKLVKLCLRFRGGDGIVHGVAFLVGCYTALL